MAGLAATRLLATAGAGGVALTVWALVRMGMPRAQIVSREAIFLVLFYAVFMGTLVVGGVGLYVGIFPGEAPFALTIVPAIFGAIVIVLALLAARFSAGIQRTAKEGQGRPSGRMSKVGRAIADASRRSRDRRQGRDRHGARAERSRYSVPSAGGDSTSRSCSSVCTPSAAPPGGVVVMAYFVGMIANTLPVREGWVPSTAA
jgi:hypothetical protein